jgi:hypothetical protein
MDLGVDMDPDMGTIFFLGSNRNKPKLNLFRFCLGLFHETKRKFSLFRCFRTIWKRTETKIGVSKQTETKD